MKIMAIPPLMLEEDRQSCIDIYYTASELHTLTQIK